MKCATCRKQLEEGVDVIQVEEGILGMRGFVPLDKVLVFCSIECLRDHFNGTEGYVLQRRVP